MKVLSLPLNAIAHGERLRPVDRVAVEALAANIEAIGLQSPIGVVADGPSQYRLVYGGHRLAAAAALGWDDISAQILDVDALGATAHELADNLVTRDLTIAERMKFLAEWKEVYDVQTGASKRGGDKKSAEYKEKNQRPKVGLCFSKAAAKKIGLSNTTIKTAVQHYQAIASDVFEQVIADPEWSNSGPLLKQLALSDETQQRYILQLMTAGDAGRGIGCVSSAKEAGELARGERLTKRDRLQKNLEAIAARFHALANRDEKIEALNHLALNIFALRPEDWQGAADVAANRKALIAQELAR